MTAKQPSRGEEKPHTLTLENRRKLALTGITEVVSFDEGLVVLNTTMGALAIEGEELHILALSLDSGCVTVEGVVNLLQYENRNEKVKRGFFKRLVH